MPVRRTVALLAAACLTLAGCSSDDGEPAAPTAGPTAASSAETSTPGGAPTALPTTSITCSSPKPAGRFTYSTEQQELEGLARLIGDPVVLDGTFDDVDAHELGLLIERGFVDPDGDTNGSPSMWEFHEFLCAHPEVRAIGFIAGHLPGDETAIASLEAVYAPTMSAELQRDARSFCRSTPERTVRGHLDCFWE